MPNYIGQNPDRSSQAAKMLLFFTLAGVSEKEFITPFEIPRESLLTNSFQLIEIGGTAFAFPLTNSGLVDANDLRELALRDPKDIGPNVFDCAHDAYIFQMECVVNIPNGFSSIPNGMYNA